MLDPFDDYPIHQTPLPVAHPGSGDRNHYDRSWFNGYDRDGAWMFGATLAIYPNRDVIDAAFSVVVDGVQRSVFASGRAPASRAATRVGPIALEVLEPLRVSRVRVEAPDVGLEADLTWEARTPAVEEPRQTLLQGPLVLMDSTRFTQWGTWHGRIDLEGSRIAVGPPAALGTKDRSWGIRPVGEPTAGAPPRAGAPPGVFFVWAPVHFPDRCMHFACFERPDGHRWWWTGGEVPLLRPGDPLWDDGGGESSIRRPRAVDLELDLAPGTRWARGATLAFRFPDGDETLAFTPVLAFPMKGLGYQNPRWAHGAWRGEEAVGAEEWEVAGLDPLAFENLHVEQLCRVRAGNREGVGILEHLIIGPHAPSGLAGMLDGAPTT
jgi:hypothetical protein